MTSTGIKTCDNCKNDSVTFIRYSGAHLCGAHFSDFIKSRVKREMRKQGRLPHDGSLALAVSGGKDSLAMLYLLAENFESHKDLTLTAITVDEGIHPYRTESITRASKACRKLGIEHRVISFKDRFGYSMDEIVKAEDPELLPCSYCGVFRRVCLNSVSKEISAAKLATGHNLDDNAQSILMNICKGDFNKLFRLGPHRIEKPGLVPRLLPLRTIPEKEIYLYTFLNDIDAYTGECLYSETALRGLYRDILNKLEDQQPGTRHAIIKMYDQLYNNIISNIASGSMKICKQCGEPATDEKCKACQMQNRISDILGK